MFSRTILRSQLAPVARRAIVASPVTTTRIAPTFIRKYSDHHEETFEEFTARLVSFITLVVR